MSQVSIVEVVTEPTLEPIDLEAAKRHLFIASTSFIHDEYVTTLIQAAREQWESDTDSAVMSQTLKVTASNFCGSAMYLPRRPISSITSVTYYDSSNALQTLATSVYALDKQARAIRLKVDQVWPGVESSRFDAIAVTYVAGVATQATVPAIAKQAMMLLIGYYFDANRGDNDRANDLRAYESLVLRYMRSTYP